MKKEEAPTFPQGSTMSFRLQAARLRLQANNNSPQRENLLRHASTLDRVADLLGTVPENLRGVHHNLDLSA
jgi:hypothetical protein